MAKWAGVFLAVMVAAAIAGFLIDAIRVIAGLLFLGCAAGLAITYLNRNK